LPRLMRAVHCSLIIVVHLPLLKVFKAIVIYGILSTPLHT
jgi:hypothetical protein